MRMILLNGVSFVLYCNACNSAEEDIWPGYAIRTTQREIPHQHTYQDYIV